MRSSSLFVAALIIAGADIATAETASEVDRACDNATGSGIPEAECEDRVVEAWDAMAVMNALERIRDGASIEAVAAESGIPSSTLQTRWDEFVLSQQDEE